MVNSLLKNSNFPQTLIFTQLHATVEPRLSEPRSSEPRSSEPSIIRMKDSVKVIDIHLLAHARFCVDNLSEAAKRFSSSLTV